MSNRKHILIVLASFMLVLAAVIACGCMNSAVTAPSGDIKKFSSADEIRDYIKNNTQLIQDENYRTDGALVAAPAPVTAAQESMVKGVSIPGAFPSAGSIGSPDYSQTNVQVAGIDEPDFVKKIMIDRSHGSKCVNCNYCSVMCDTERETKCYKY